MEFRTKIFIALVFFFLFGGILFAKEYFFWGEITFVSSGPYTIIVQGETPSFCKNDRCTFRLFPKKYTVVATKEGYKNFVGEIEIAHQTKQEMTINFIALPVFEHVAKEIMEKRIFPMWKKNEQSVLPPALLDVEEENGMWVWQKKIPLITFNTRIASDEIGRGFWMIDEKNIFFFNTQTRQNSLVFSHPITHFLPLYSGDLIATDAEKNVFWIQENMQKKLEIGKTFIPFSLCSSSSGKFWGLEKDQNYAMNFILFEWNEKTQKKTVKGKLEGISLENFSFSFCSPVEYGLMWNNGEAEILRL